MYWIIFIFIFSKGIALERLVNIPIIDGKLYEKVILENMKRTFLENAYNDAINGSIEQQNKFISEMTPVLDDFYADKEKNWKKIKAKNERCKNKNWKLTLKSCY